MLIIDCFGHNIIIDNKIVGYLKDNTLIVNGHKFADITDKGEIFFNQRLMGYVDDDGSIIIKGHEAGYINGNNDFVFYKEAL